MGREIYSAASESGRSGCEELSKLGESVLLARKPQARNIGIRLEMSCRTSSFQAHLILTRFGQLFSNTLVPTSGMSLVSVGSLPAPSLSDAPG